MLVVAAIIKFATFETLLVGIPESVGLLVFGVGLILAAVFIRRLLGRNSETKVDEKLGKKV